MQGGAVRGGWRGSCGGDVGSEVRDGDCGGGVMFQLIRCLS